MGAKLQIVVVKSNNVGIRRYYLSADRFLTLEEKNQMKKLSEDEFMEIVHKNKWVS